MKLLFNGIPVELGTLKSSAFGGILNQYKGRNIVIMVDENTHNACLEGLFADFPTLKNKAIILLPSGEENKNIEVVFQVWSALLERKIQRKDLIINVGGGMVTDLGGFVAATYKRGIDFIHIPTSLLAMVDAALGGKTGIDLNGVKNAVGTFTSPKAIFIDPVFLETLPAHEIFNGLAEMMKHALILDVGYWNKLKRIRNEEALTTVENILRSIQLKKEVVESDSKESNRRKLLNFGHTFGHGIESYFIAKKPIAHGHAVALGMIAESFVAFKRKVLSQKAYVEIEQVLIDIFPMPPIPENAFQEILSHMKQDKKNTGNHVNFVLLKEPGVAEIDAKLTEREIGEALLHLSLLAQNRN
ncbi:MAG: 3-dehydroquinate synthase [Bacteroidetes bacterium]|nr:3-dehydroquinate synthase [Bacteroidota bacterium]